MGNYKVKNTEILEISTNQIIKRFQSKKEAINMCNLLNSGSGFNGHTPRFLLIQVPQRT